jgi:hypothetical protein
VSGFTRDTPAHFADGDMQVVSQRFVDVPIAEIHPHPQNPNGGDVIAVLNSEIRMRRALRRGVKRSHRN